MDPPGLPGQPGSPQPTRSWPTIATAPSTTQSRAAPTANNNESGVSGVDQLESLEAFTKQVVSVYTTDAHRLGYIDKDEVVQLENLTGQPANVISSVSRKFYIALQLEKLMPG